VRMADGTRCSFAAANSSRRADGACDYPRYSGRCRSRFRAGGPPPRIHA
jgi:hypothetical protein